MAEIRVDVKDLSRDINALLARMDAGDDVLVERDGAPVAALTPCGKGAPEDALALSEEKGLRAFLMERLRGPRWPDEEYELFINDLEDIRAWLNSQETRNPWDD